MFAKTLQKKDLKINIILQQLQAIQIKAYVEAFKGISNVNVMYFTPRKNFTNTKKANELQMLRM